MKKDLVVSAMNDACDIIVSTMGSKGRSVLIQGQGFFTTTDGATVAGYIKGDGNLGTMGVKLVQQACWKTRDEAGDGTTCTAALIKGLLPFINDYHPVVFDNMLSEFEAEVMERLEKEMIDFDLLDVCLTSAHGIEDIADAISNAVEKVGQYGMLDYTNGYGKIRAEFHDGYYFPEKVLSKHFGHIDVIDPMILIIEQKVEHHSDLLPIYRAWHTINKALEEDAKKKGTAFLPRPLIVFASDIYGSALDMAVTNYKGGTPVIFIKTPETGERRVDILHDLQFITDTYKVFSYYGGQPLTSFGKSYEKKDISPIKEFGTAKRIISNDKGTTIHFDRKDTEEYTKDWDMNEWNKERLARLTCGVGTIFVGGETAVEQEYRAHLIDDTIRSAFASKDGVIRGGGLPLWEIAEDLIDKYPFAGALRVPREIILSNADIPTSDKEVDVLGGARKPRDTKKAIQSAVKNSISVIKTISNVERILCDQGESIVKNY